MDPSNVRSGQKWRELSRGESAAQNLRLRRARILDDLLRGNGPPLATRELAQMIGMSQTFIRGEIRSGHLRAAVVGRGRKRVFRIPIREARRYATELGLL